LGIGLTVVKSLVELHHGKVRAESDGVGRGSAFTVLVPSSSISTSAPVEAVPAQADVGTTLSRVLVVDDNKDTTDGLTRLLLRAGYDVQAAYDGPSALAMAADFHPEIVLLDLGLPIMDGFQVVQALRLTEEGKKLRLIALSGYGQDEDQRRSREAGFDLHLVKPVEFSELRKAMAGAEERAG
jgi:CheY-like chemotaxis protein